MPHAWLPLDAPPRFPPGCACCSGEASGHLVVNSKFRAAESLLKPVDRPWKVPYCDECLAHVDAAWRRGGSLKKRWMMVAVLLFLPGLLVHAVLIAMIPVFLLGTGIVYAIAGHRMRQVKTRPECAAPTPAVLRRGPDRDRYFIRLLNPAYAERYAELAAEERVSRNTLPTAR